MEKLDLTKHYKPYYTAKAKPDLVQIEPARFISIAGKGDPSSEGFRAHIETLYPIAYALKFNSKAARRDFAVAKLEGLWWFDELKYKNMQGDKIPVKVPRDDWEYRLMIRLPEWLDKNDLETAKKKVAEKKGLDVSQVEYFEMQEGLSVQILHTGSYENEPATLALMHAFMEEKGLKRNGQHHEIYLSDFRKTSPEKLKTILRQPVQAVGGEFKTKK